MGDFELYDYNNNNRECEQGMLLEFPFNKMQHSLKYGIFYYIFREWVRILLEMLLVRIVLLAKHKIRGIVRDFKRRKYQYRYFWGIVYVIHIILFCYKPVITHSVKHFARFFMQWRPKMKRLGLLFPTQPQLPSLRKPGKSLD